jgi:hypothetical protein
VAALALTLLGTPITPAAAQCKASELQTISQTVDGTAVTRTCARPRRRGRTNV